MVKIHRIWFNTERMDREDHYKITLFSRPRVSIHVDEYIWSFIEENIVKPHKLMRSEKHGYLLDISFDQFDHILLGENQVVRSLPPTKSSRK